MRKHYTAEQKAKIVIEMLAETKTTAQISPEYGIHPNQLYHWKAQVVEGIPGLFGKGEKAERENCYENRRL